MKYIIKNNEESEPKIRLWLLEDKKDRIILKGRDKNGEERYLMEFQNGKFRRNVCVELEGLEIDKDGRIIEE